MSGEEDLMETSGPDETTREEGEAPKELTAEEKAERVRHAEERIKQRRLELQEEEKQKEIEREKVRRREGQDLVKIKSEMEWREAQKLAEERKREKQEDRLARQRVKDQIAEDRARMKEAREKEKQALSGSDQSQSAEHPIKTDDKSERERIKQQIEIDRANMRAQKREHGSSEHQASRPTRERHVISEKEQERLERQRIREQIAIDRADMKMRTELEKQAHAVARSTTHAGANQPQLAPNTKKDYTEAKLQIRLPSNSKLVQAFGVDEPLSAVRLYVDLHSDGELGPFIELATSYPRKVFSEEDMQMSLRELDLVPTSVLLATRGKDPEVQ